MSSSSGEVQIKIRVFISCLVAVILLAGACAASPGVPPEETPVPTQLSPAIGEPPTPSLSGEEPLPEPIITSNSVELCLNSRYSEHRLTGTADNQQIANILWAAGKAPVVGSYRNIYVATPNGEYVYDPVAHLLSPRSERRVSLAAFVINCESALAFDTGVTYMMATLSSVSLWKSSEAAVASCPKMTSLYFGVQEVRGLTSELVAHSSVPPDDPGWLPDPSTNGQNTIEEVLADLKYVTSFSLENLSLQQISQLLWAGYGCTPHEALGGRKGLTVPSAMANYYLTGTIYIASERGVHRYQNRNPSTDMTTRDHRLEPITSSDVRSGLQASVSNLPKAPDYIIICLGEGLTNAPQEQNWALLETGFVAANVLVQASAMGLGCHFDANLTSTNKQVFSR